MKYFWSASDPPAQVLAELVVIGVLKRDGNGNLTCDADAWLSQLGRKYEVRRMKDEVTATTAAHGRTGGDRVTIEETETPAPALQTAQGGKGGTAFNGRGPSVHGFKFHRERSERPLTAVLSAAGTEAWATIARVIRMRCPGVARSLKKDYAVRTIYKRGSIELPEPDDPQKFGIMGAAMFAERNPRLIVGSVVSYMIGAVKTAKMRGTPCPDEYAAEAKALFFSLRDEQPARPEMTEKVETMIESLFGKVPVEADVMAQSNAARQRHFREVK